MKNDPNSRQLSINSLPTTVAQRQEHRMTSQPSDGSEPRESRRYHYGRRYVADLFFEHTYSWNSRWPTKNSENTRNVRTVINWHLPGERQVRKTERERERETYPATVALARQRKEKKKKKVISRWFGGWWLRNVTSDTRVTMMTSPSFDEQRRENDNALR